MPLAESWAPYLQAGLAVGDGGRALRRDHHWYMEAVFGQSSSSTGYTESLSQRVPRLSAEDWVNQLDDLVLEEWSPFLGKTTLHSNKQVNIWNSKMPYSGRVINGGLVDCLTSWLISWRTDRLVNRFARIVFDWVPNWLTGQLIDWWISLLFNWRTSRLVDDLTGGLVERWIGRMVDWWNSLQVNLLTSWYSTDLEK